MKPPQWNPTNCLQSPPVCRFTSVWTHQFCEDLRALCCCDPRGRPECQETAVEEQKNNVEEEASNRRQDDENSLLGRQRDWIHILTTWMGEKREILWTEGVRIATCWSGGHITSDNKSISLSAGTRTVVRLNRLIELGFSACINVMTEPSLVSKPPHLYRSPVQPMLPVAKLTYSINI